MALVHKTITDSIAIEIINPHVLITGVGNELHMHTENGSDVLPHKLRSKVHGIVRGFELTDSEDKLLVYGEKEFMLLKFSGTKELNFELLHWAHLTDWISAACFLNDIKEFVLLTAHSVLLRLSFDEIGTKSCNITARFSCSDKSTLYCAHLHGNTWQKLVVFGGNAFGELLIWQPSNSTAVSVPTKKPTPVELLTRIQLHSGVIFSIDYNADFNILTTTSDDRSIRLWHVAQKENKWRDCRFKAIAAGYGHGSRVFQGKIIIYKNEPYAITVGEDSYFCLWQRSGELMYKHRLQFGAVIWNFTFCNDTQTLFTVGSLGNLVAFNLREALESNVCPKELIEYPATNNAEYVAKVKLFADDLIIAMTNKNRLLYARNDDEHGKWLWYNVALNFEPYNCTVLEVSRSGHIALCGYKRLTLLHCTRKENILHFVSIFDGAVLPGIIRTFHFLDENSYLVSDGLGNCKLLNGPRLSNSCDILLPPCKEPFLTAALVLSEELLLLSNRMGNLLLFKMEPDTKSFALKDKLKQPHGPFGVTVLQVAKRTDQEIFVRSAGHNNLLRMLSISKSALTIKECTRQPVPMNWVERIFTIDKIGEMVLGFCDQNLAVWSKETDTALKVPCGGGHRSWDFLAWNTRERDKILGLIFIKNKAVILHRCKVVNRISTKVKLPTIFEWHARPCNIMATIDQSENQRTVMISAGDDNLIKISKFEQDEKKSTLSLCVDIHSHISNVRALKVLMKNNECFIYSGGGRAQLCLTKIDLQTFHAEELLSYTIRQTEVQNSKNYVLDPETRIMCLDVLSDGTEDKIFLGCSDGYVRKYKMYNLALTPLECLFYGKCVLQLQLVAGKFVLVSGTDGFIRLYDLELNKLYLELPQHASGINALAVHYENEDHMLHLLTGGDDQLVVYTALNLASKEPTVANTFRFEGLHTAQVTAAHLQRVGFTLYGWTSGVDQNLFKLNLTTGKVLQCHHSCVADIKGVCVDRRQRCFLYGCGLQICNFEDRTSDSTNFDCNLQLNGKKHSQTSNFM